MKAIKIEVNDKLMEQVCRALSTSTGCKLGD
ncbi:MAG: hypothetical protein ALAOOOJD_02505 [bacterium]|nr:hypothetical protein [bacterium]